jgi:RecA/RadA recombinase
MIFKDIEMMEQIFNNKEKYESIKTGISFLDHAIQGIEKDDVILVGGYSGAGKTEFITLLAKNISKKKKVAILALEARDNELYERTLFKEFVNICKQKYPNEYFNFLNFKNKKYSTEFYKEIKQAQLLVSKEQQGLNILYRTTEEFGIKELSFSILSAKDNGFECVILDHIHYLDLESDKENIEFKKIIKQIRDLGLIHQIPIIVVAHFRKKNFNDKTFVPLKEEFQGTSDLYKIVTKVITMSSFIPKDTERDNFRYDNMYEFLTCFSVQKHRDFGETCNYCGVIKFNSLTKTYSNSYVLIKQKFNYNDYELVTEDKKPYWFKEECLPKIDENILKVQPKLFGGKYD